MELRLYCSAGRRDATDSPDVYIPMFIVMCYYLRPTTEILEHRSFVHSKMENDLFFFISKVNYKMRFNIFQHLFSHELQIYFLEGVSYLFH